MKKDKKHTIFIVENHEPYSMMLKYKLLRKADFRILSFHSWEECVENVYLKPDAIVLDSNLPELSALKTVTILLRDFSKIPVFVLLSFRDTQLNGEIGELRNQSSRKGLLDFLLNEGDTTLLAERLVTRLTKAVHRQEQQRFHRRRAMLLIGTAICLVAFLTIWSKI